MSTRLGVELDSEITEMTRCPVTKSKLVLASPNLIANLNRQIESGLIFNHAGQPIETRVESGMVNEDKTFFLPIRNGIVILVVDQAIKLGEQT